MKHFSLHLLTSFTMRMKNSMNSSYLVCLFFVLISYSSSMATKLDENTDIVPPSTFPKLPPSKPWKGFDSIGSSSTNRARNLGQKKSTLSSSSANIPIFTDYKGALIQLAFGTPPQLVHLILDTASSITWLPCGLNYSCHNCFSWNEQFTDTEIFDPNLSSSSKYLGCNDPLYQFLTGPRVTCKNCRVNSTGQCLQPVDYTLNYANGSTTGRLLLENLKSPQKILLDFIVGCSTLTKHLPLVGLAGFGRGLLSLPSQLGIKKFSYCLSSSLINVKPPRSYFVLNDISRTRRLSYTPFFEGPSTNIFQNYYYIILNEIIIGRRSIKIPHGILMPGSDGNGGTILDSGATISLMESSIFQAVIKEFRKWSGKDFFIRKMDSTHCFNATDTEVESFPKLVFRFRGGVEMNLPLPNYLMKDKEKNVKCLAIRPKFGGDKLRPTIVLGNMQLRDFHMEYDLENERFGFRKTKCT